MIAADLRTFLGHTLLVLAHLPHSCDQSGMARNKNCEALCRSLQHKKLDPTSHSL